MRREEGEAWFIVWGFLNRDRKRRHYWLIIVRGDSGVIGSSRSQDLWRINLHRCYDFRSR